MSRDAENPATPAVVVGMCSHGLAISRSLGRRGIPVYALESNPRLPAIRTRFARVFPAADVNGPPLIADLLEFRRRFRENPVLYVTNDNMVRTVAGGAEELQEHYRLHWPEPGLVRKLLDKQHIESVARASGLRYPRSILISGIADLDRVRGDLQFPMAFKPTRPLSRFKAMKVASEAELIANLERYGGPSEVFLLQEWVSGAEPSIYFANFYFDRDHRPVATFVGRKVRSYPRNLGGACSVEPADRPDIAEEALRFFQSAPVRGPASLEIKEDESGRRFVIEPTIGRFDFYILGCIANGVDFPYVSYAYQTGAPIPKLVQARAPGTMWVDFENDFPALAGSLSEAGGVNEAVQFLLRRKIFALWAWDDPMPSALEWPHGLRKYAGRAWDHLARAFPKRAPANTA